MSKDLHDQTQQWLLTKCVLSPAEIADLQSHLNTCPECRQLANQVNQLEEHLAFESMPSSLSTSLLKQKSNEVRDKFERRHMKTNGMNFLRFAGWATLTVLVLAVGWIARTWFTTPGNPIEPANHPVLAAESTPDAVASTSPPLAIDPALCDGPSISEHLPEGEIAFDGGQIMVGKMVFEFWLTCSNTTTLQTNGTQPITGLGLYAIWSDQNPTEDVINDTYGFDPQLFPASIGNPVSEGTTTSSGTSGILSVTEEGSDLQGMFILPHLEDQLSFITHLETKQGTYQAAIRFHLEAGENGYRPVDVHIEGLPFIASTTATDDKKFSYPIDSRLNGPGICSAESVSEIKKGLGEFTLPLKEQIADQEFPGVKLFSRETSEPVMAADAGTVIYAGNDTTNGLVLIDHANGYQTMYSHLFKVNVMCGDMVEKGQMIGTIRSTPEEPQAYLIYELYFEGVPVNPIGR